MKRETIKEVQKLSMRKYAAILGVSHTAVAKAVKSGHIEKGFDKETKKIIVGIANSEWGNDVKEKNNNKQISNIEETLLTETLLSEKDLPQVRTDISFTEARRRKEIYNAEIARITAYKEQSLYVEKEKVFMQLFEYGKQIRIALQSVPDRIIDNVLIAKNRYEGHQLITEAINEALEQLSKTPVL